MGVLTVIFILGNKQILIELKIKGESKNLDMNKNLAVGEKIIISKDYHWAKNAIGEIIKVPDYIIEIADGWKNNIREVTSSKGNLYFYWIKFDEPQIDADGDGPYSEAEIDSNFITLFYENN